MQDIYKIGKLVGEINELKQKDKEIKKKLMPKIQAVKDYMKENNKRRLKLKDFSVSYQIKTMRRYNTNLIKKYIDSGECPKDVILFENKRDFLIITSVNDIELVGNKFVVKKK